MSRKNKNVIVAEEVIVEEEPIEYFTDAMHKGMFIFQDPLSSKFTSKGGKILDPIRTRSAGAIKGNRRISVR
jgi:hypothetical protein